MPSTIVEVRREYPPPEEVAILDAVHKSLVSAFGIPAHDRHLGLVVHEPHRFLTDPRLAQPDRCTLVTIDCFAGRTIDAKRQMYREIVSRLAGLDIPAEHVTVLIREAAPQNWGIRGAKPPVTSASASTSTS